MYFWGKKWKRRKELISFLKEGKYDIVPIHRNDIRWILSYCASKAGIKAIYTTHNIFRKNILLDGYSIYLNKMIKEYGLTNNIVYLGSINAVLIVCELQNYNACVIPS